MWAAIEKERERRAADLGSPRNDDPNPSSGVTSAAAATAGRGARKVLQPAKSYTQQKVLTARPYDGRPSTAERHALLEQDALEKERIAR